ncbi:MAG: rod shape-determining protein MreC [Anaerolineae bacterium]|nr:rod shape-determining protein MreC [Anaerolineae bacterium]
MKRDSGPWLAWVLLILALVLIGLSESGALGPAEGLLSFVVAPVERAVAVIVKGVGSVTGKTRDVVELQQRVAELESGNEVLVQENFRLREYQAENEELRRQLNFHQENPTYGSIGVDVVEQGCTIFPCGDVVGQDTNPYLRFVIINVGSQAGVAVGMPVVTGGAAMIGRIARTSPNLSYVQLINDPASFVVAMLQQSRVMGIVEGSEEGQLLMTNILPDEEVAEGETIITSSIGGMLPRGLILGQVESVDYLESDLFQRAAIRPAIDFRRIETVLVITDFPQPDLDELIIP